MHFICISLYFHDDDDDDDVSSRFILRSALGHRSFLQTAHRTRMNGMAGPFKKGSSL